MIIKSSKKQVKRWMQIVFILIFSSSIILGCQSPWENLPESPTEAEISQAKSPSTPTPTREPRLDLPPALVEASPLPGSVISIEQPITLFFNQEMEPGSVEASIHFNPRVSGRFTWEDATKLTFTPDQGLTPGSRQQLTIDTSAQASNKQNLQTPIELNFQVTDQLKVTQSLPEDGTVDVDPQSIIFVSFNQPVVPLGDVTGSEPGFIVEPEIKGEGSWLNTSTYVFKPQPTMLGGTKYSIKINQNLRSTLGASLDPQDTLAIDFMTAKAEIIKVQPQASEKLSLNGPITIDFNIRMDPESVEENFKLFDSQQQQVKGKFEWDESYKQVSFVPDLLLDRDESYQAKLDTAALSEGRVPLSSGLDTSWKTFPSFAVNTSVQPEFESFYGGYGQFRLNFTTMLEPKNLESYIQVSPEVSDLFFHTEDSDPTLWVSGYFQPDTIYTLTVEKDLKDIWGESLKDKFSTTFSTPPAKAYMGLTSGYSSYGLFFVPASQSTLALQATNINAVTVEISPIRFSDLLTLLNPENYQYRDIFLPEVRETTTHQLNLKRNRSEVVTLPLSYQGESLNPGIYYLGLFSPEIEEEWNRYQKYYLIVSENNLVLKIAPDQVLIWGTQSGDLMPLTGSKVAVYDTQGELLSEGKFDSSGFYVESYERRDDLYSDYFAIVGEPGDKDFSFSISTWQDWYFLYQKGINLNTSPTQVDADIYIDRPIYRPGDTIHFKTIIFSRENGLPVFSNEDRVRVVLNGNPGVSGRTRTFYSKTLMLSQFGTASGSVDLPEDAATGYYWIEIYIGENLIKSLYFDVATYRKPNIDLAIEFDDSEILIGNDIKAKVQADYFFGSPSADQAFTWSLFRKDKLFVLPGYQVGPMENFWTEPFIPEFSPLGGYVVSGEGITGEEGKADISIPAQVLNSTDVQEGGLQEYNLEITMMEPGGFPVSDRTSLLIHPETFYIGIMPNQYFGSAGSEFDFSILTVDWQKEPVANIKTEAMFEAIHWNVLETGMAERPYRYEAITELIGSASPITDRAGEARVSFTPQSPGTYRLTIKSNDALTEVLIWVQGESAAIWPIQMQNWVDLTANLDQYQPGQTAEIFIPNPFSRDAKALVTLERGKIITKQALDIKGSGEVFSIPITEEMIPNIYVSVIILGKDAQNRPDFRQGMINLSIPPYSKTLDVDIVLKPSITEPGKTVSMDLMITDQKGQPVQGEFSISVVDKALLALVEPTNTPILEAFYGKVQLSVETSLSLYTFAKQLLLSSSEAGGLGGGADEITTVSARKNFPDTAFWEAHIITGADGTAQLSIPLPDTLTTWVVEVRGLSETYLVGQAEAELQTQKPLMIEPITPRFVVDGDMVELAAVVYNNTDEELEVDVSLKALGLVLADKDPSRKIKIAAGRNQLVSWWGKVESVETVSLVFGAKSGDLTDSSIPVWGDLKVKRYLMPQTFSSAGQIIEADKKLELVSLLTSTDPSSGDLRLTLNPSLLGTLLEGLEAFEVTPYSDTATELSRLLANLSTYSVINNLAIDSEEVDLSLENLIEESINLLLATQYYDGGWSWWGGSQNDHQSSDPFITAYVLFGLENAKAEGFEIEDNFLDLARDYLIFHLENPEDITESWRLDLLTFKAYVLRNHHPDLFSNLGNLFDRRSELSPWAVGLLALTMKDQGGMNVEIKTLLGDLENRAIRSATGIHWESDGRAWMLPGTPIFNTAATIFAIAQLDPASESLTPGLQYLLAHQDSRSWWSSSFESAWVLMAIPKVIQGTGGYLADFAYQAKINDDFLIEGEATGSAFAERKSIEMGIDSLYHDSPNTLLIERGEGTGTLYYRVDLQTYQPAADAQAIQAGINVERDYYPVGLGCPFEENCTPLTQITLDPSEQPQFVQAVVTVNLTHDMYNVMVEDFIPAGAEIVNQELLTTSTIVDPTESYVEPMLSFDKGWGWWYFNSPQIYDDHILWTAEYVPAGTYILMYKLLPFQRGTYQVLPAHAWQFFYPEVQGTSTGSVFEIK